MKIPLVEEPVIFQPAIIYGSLTVPLPLFAIAASSVSFSTVMGSCGVYTCVIALLTESKNDSSLTDCWSICSPEPTKIRTNNNE
jgi:hypothetical protein